MLQRRHAAHPTQWHWACSFVYCRPPWEGTAWHNPLTPDSDSCMYIYAHLTLHTSATWIKSRCGRNGPITQGCFAQLGKSLKLAASVSARLLLMHQPASQPRLCHAVIRIAARGVGRHHAADVLQGAVPGLFCGERGGQPVGVGLQRSQGVGAAGLQSSLQEVQVTCGASTHQHGPTQIGPRVLPHRTCTRAVDDGTHTYTLSILSRQHSSPGWCAASSNRSPPSSHHSSHPPHRHSPVRAAATNPTACPAWLPDATLDATRSLSSGVMPTSAILAASRAS